MARLVVCKLATTGRTPNWIFGIEADIQASGEGASGNAQQSGPQTLVAASISCVPSCGNPRSSTSISQSISQNGSLLWFGTVRGRIGYAIWPTVMLYGTGGLAYGRLNESVSASFNGSCTTNVPPCGGSIGFGNGTVLSVPFSVGQSFETAVTKTGWTVGGGVEGVVPNTHVTWKAEYLYMDLGTQNYTFSNPLLGTILVNTHFTDNIVRVGLNYQFH
jgi:outer membrane immunogenic protein